ncbi:cytochrome P450 [Artomyces pyxidatus]|uniref:Cytochrome P450 n=1 Tax=Artomyces pyxidatus TaxID=48021 RepID=A0ACB8TLK5_9AGAM|nr:cytochrome P450 [Artomyces pyxidatus]
MNFFTTFVSLVAIVAIFFVFRTLRDRRRRRGLPYPPGPKRLPGAKTYGDVISLRVPGQVIVILNCPKPARDLLDKRSATYSARPVIPFYDLADWGWLVPTARYDDAWRARRKIIDHGLRPSASLQYQPLQRTKALDLVRNLASSPERFREHLELCQGAIIMPSVYGYDVKERGDRYIDVASEISKLLWRTILPGALLVNDLPMMGYLPEWLPGMAFESLARHGRKLGEDMRYPPFQFVKNGMRSGTARPSMTLTNLQEVDDIDSPESENAQRLIAEALGSLYTAGADTTVSAMATFFLMLVQYPDIQKKAQAELDAITGRTRLPDFSDRARLPYTEAICKELIRCRVVTPLGAPQDMTLFIVVASVLSVFTVGQAKDALGNEIQVDCVSTGALVR